ncbi:MAG: right-handed parallel beta-helix repeat-containing protein [Gemmatimonadota bacterium]
MTSERISGPGARAVLTAVALLLGAAPLAAQQPRPCMRLSRAGTEVQGEVRVCPGRYRVPDPGEEGVLVVTAPGTTINLTNVVLESGESVPGQFVGAGVLARNVDAVTITGGAIRGYRHGIRIEGGRGHRIAQVDVSGSRLEPLRSTETTFDPADWLNVAAPAVFEQYGAGIVLRNTEGVIVTRIRSQRGQNGIALIGVRDSYIADSDVSGNAGWGIHLWASARNTIVRNIARENVRCETAAYSKGCGSAALLLRERSDSNLIADNDLTASGNGLLMAGGPPDLEPSVGNTVVRNDGSFAYHTAFEATYSSGNLFIDNRADSSAYGFWLGYSTSTTVRGNRVLGARQAGIAIAHGADNSIAGNTVIGGQVGIRIFAPDSAGPASRGYRIDDNLLAECVEAISLERTTQARIRGNLFDMVGDALVIDESGAATEVAGNFFLRARGNYIDAPRLSAGGNFWGTFDLDAAARKVKGDIILEPWRPASAGGF